jgi:hypothetical protein
MTIHMIQRSSRLTLLIAVGLSLGLASCNDSDNNNDDSRTVTSVATQEISQNTTDVDDPILINDLALSDGDTTETDLPSEI